MTQATRACVQCSDDFTGPSYQRYCGTKCRRKARYARTREKSIAYTKKWKQENPEKHAQYVRTWAQRNPEKRAAAAKARYKANPQAYYDAAKRYVQRHPELVAERKRRWHERNRESRCEARRRWAAENPDANRRYMSKRKALRIGNPGSVGVSQRDWVRLLRRYDYACAYCGSKDRIHMEHVIPLSRGGRDAIGNVLPACRSCNLSKRTRFLADWRYRRLMHRGRRTRTDTAGR